MRCSRRLATESSRSVLLGLALTVAGSAACERGDKPRVPPAAEWKEPEAKASEAGAKASAADESDPHAGVDMGGGDPHAGLDMGGGDPHAGLDMGGGDPHAGLRTGGGDPHAGLGGDRDPHANLDLGDGGVDPAMAGMKAPDPDRPIDASKFLRGKIRAAVDVESAIRAGSVLFLSAWPVDPTTGDVLGSPVAVAKLTVDKLPMPFELSERDVMVDGTSFAGDVQITARVDADGEARTKEPGDVEGRLRARIPAAGLDLVLDTKLR